MNLKLQDLAKIDLWYLLTTTISPGYIKVHIFRSFLFIKMADSTIHINEFRGCDR
jgi:hypothetical protein